MNQAERLSDRHMKLLSDMREHLLAMMGEIRKLTEAFEKLLKELREMK